MRAGDHYAVDLDGVLAEAVDPHQPGVIGPPIPAMVERVKAWRAEGIEVRIFTARISDDGDEERRRWFWREHAAIGAWCIEHLGEVLMITCQKSWRTARIYNDRAIAVERNTGRLLSEEPA